MQVFKEIMKKLRDLDLLLIIDNAENFMVAKEILKEFLELIFEGSHTIKVMMTSKIEPMGYLGSIGGVKD